MQTLPRLTVLSVKEIYISSTSSVQRGLTLQQIDFDHPQSTSMLHYEGAESINPNSCQQMWHQGAQPGQNKMHYMQVQIKARAAVRSKREGPTGLAVSTCSSPNYK